MGAYMYPINIELNRKTIRCTKEIYISSSDMHDIKTFSKYVKSGDTFSLYRAENERIILAVYKTKLETIAEWRKRVSKEKAYMKRYAEFQAKNKKV